jgi:hypothetical protein
MVESLVEAIEADGWDVADTVPDDLPVSFLGAPSLGSDDDDPTALAQFGLAQMAVPNDASELDDDACVDSTGDDS